MSGGFLKIHRARAACAAFFPTLLLAGFCPRAAQAVQAPPGATIRVGPSSDTGSGYSQLTAAGINQELPDCKHAVPHITIQKDAELTGQVFAFSAHRDLDNDRCMNTDRQRTELRVLDKTIVNGTVSSHSWKFRLDAGFKPSGSFTHIHQIKALGGDDDAPIWTLDALSDGGGTLKVMYVGPSNNSSFPASVPLAPFKGAWVEAVEKITYGQQGKFSIVIKRVSDGQTLLSYSKDNVSNWRSGSTQYSPKWGIYRSLNEKGSLRDETVLFADFCRAANDFDCVGGPRDGATFLRAPARMAGRLPTEGNGVNGMATQAGYARRFGGGTARIFGLDGRLLGILAGP